jgi:hypothetical protein
MAEETDSTEETESTTESTSEYDYVNYQSIPEAENNCELTEVRRAKLPDVYRKP